ncbi:hypothetical protein GUJ93_ZPchr0006g43473 [Zizania palustris]|uniref:VQ domain-containing protein n=1 Tax=Zizania palustris TaxID=103762 RepID=A0A8J5TBK8_ZIZPA|nr:hypothetical protein GUJ93_ZPchr0006g43473 [Zizania palustris]
MLRRSTVGYTYAQTADARAVVCVLSLAPAASHFCPLLSTSNLSCPPQVAPPIRALHVVVVRRPSMAAASFDGDVRHSGGAGAGAGALGVHAASRKIGKTAAAAGRRQQQQQRKPVIIYMVSPKIIHVEAHEFMSLVQRLTGPEAAAGGDKRGGSSPASSSSSPRAPRAPPVRVKALALNRPAGPAVSVSVSATRQQQQQQLPPPSASSSAAEPSPSPSGFLFHDLSPLRGGALKGEAPLVSPGSWLQHHVGDHFFSPGAAALGSPSAFLDIFGPLPSQHHQ